MHGAKRSVSRPLLGGYSRDVDECPHGLSAGAMFVIPGSPASLFRSLVVGCHAAPEDGADFGQEYADFGDLHFVHRRDRGGTIFGRLEADD